MDTYYRLEGSKNMKHYNIISNVTLGYSPLSRAQEDVSLLPTVHRLNQNWL